MHPQLMSCEIWKSYLTKEIKLGLGSSEILNARSLSLSLSLSRSQVHELIFFGSLFIISLADRIIACILARIRMWDCHFLWDSFLFLQATYTPAWWKDSFLHCSFLGFLPSFLRPTPLPFLLSPFSFFCPILREKSLGFPSTPTSPWRERILYFYIFWMAYGISSGFPFRNN